MLLIILSLLAGGLLAGLVQFFVDFKQLPIYDPRKTTESVESNDAAGFWGRLLKFFRDHWQFFGYLTVGVAGAMLVPLINELVPTNLSGLKSIKTPPDHMTIEYSWSLLVLVGYGVVFGYSAVRLLRSIGSIFLERISKSQQQLDETIRNLKNEVGDLKSSAVQGQNATIQDAGDRPTPNTGDDEAAFKELGVEPALESTGCAETPKPWKTWRLASSLVVLRESINKLAPGRSKASDGSIGDLAHQNRSSDHNPWVRDGETNRGVVTAIDVTHDPNGGCDCNTLAKSLETGKDPRIKYVIWNRQIMNSAVIGSAAAWTWRPYTGSNPHNKHTHVSVKCDVVSYDDGKSWDVAVK